MAALMIGALFFYMLWALRISRQTVLMAWIPEWTIYVAVSVLIGLVFAGRRLFRRAHERRLEQIADSFMSGACVGFVLAMNSCNVGAYLLPGESVQYVSDYEIRMPGPSLGRSNRCEAGVWIKDLNTQQRIQLCASKADLDNQIQPGMDAVWVTAHSNEIGSYISGYQFVYKHALAPTGL
ncbi:hypothetical protein DYL59_13085 [Pseudomonas kairouanensis]|uniref:Uncharacterized protein n=1 Tax=Pseudomonas kairouanensis TaxID=2293832 RepID=A0A4Z0ARY0_9PSED|nr:hypothetical protein [Pseudomonas kairouanensis]TFY89157.1 hypothetical protein DYL59_13085 [Pseudomonas kairouanensis]